MENRGFEEDRHGRGSPRMAFRDADSATEASHVYEVVLSVDDAEETIARDLLDRVPRDGSPHEERIADGFRRNLTLPFRRGAGLDASVVGSSVRATNPRRSDREAGRWDAHDDRLDRAIAAQFAPLRIDGRSNRRRRKKDCKRCRSKAVAVSVIEPGEIDDAGTTVSWRNGGNASDPLGMIDSRDVAGLSACSATANESSSAFGVPEKIAGSPAGSPRSAEGRIDEGSGDADAEAARTTQPGMRVNSIYSQDRWFAKGTPIFFTDVKEQHGSFQRAYSLPERAQTPSSQNRINLRRSVRGEPPPHPARLRKHRHGWTLHLAHPLETSGCTRSLALLLVALLVLLGIGIVALYIALEPEKLQMIQQYLKSTNESSPRGFTVPKIPDEDRRNESRRIDAPLDNVTELPEPEVPEALPLDDLTASSVPVRTTVSGETNATGNVTRYCDDCLREEVCVALLDEEVPICRAPRDPGDPTGCAGFCLINKQKCHRLDVDAFRCVEVEHSCLDDEWTCLNTMCIPLEKRCDGHMNCYDHSDEYNCVCDPETHFQCGNETSCLEMEKRCDGRIDCWDAADEINCTLGRTPGGSCPSENEFTCSDGQCISRTRFCDGLPDCVDGSDEPHGCRGRCNKHEFTCQNSRCITKAMKCNGLDDCGDGSDESYCKDRFP